MSLPGARPTLLAGGRLPLAFIGFGLGCAALAVATAADWDRGLQQPHFHPQTVALAHLWLPGFLLSVCLGALYQLMPVILGTPLRLREGALWTHLFLHGAGTVGLVVAFVAGRYLWAALGGVCVAGGVLILGAATVRTFVMSRRRDVIAWSCLAGVGWLLATVFSGILLAANRSAGFLPVDILGLLRAHAHLGLLGFFWTLLQGVTFQLVPMFTMGEFRRPRWATAGLICTQLALPLLAIGFAGVVKPAVVGGLLLVLTGFGASGWALRATLASRRRRRLDPSLQAFLVGAGLAALAAVMGTALVLLPPSRDGQLAGSATYGLLVAGGAFALMVLGMLGKILPFLVWMRAYGPRVGRETVPPATQLGHSMLERVWLGLHLVAMVLLLAGVVAGATAIVRAGAFVFATAMLTYLINAACIVRHLWRPGLSAPLVSPSHHLV